MGIISGLGKLVGAAAKKSGKLGGKLGGKLAGTVFSNDAAKTAKWAAQNQKYMNVSKAMGRGVKYPFTKQLGKNGVANKIRNKPANKHNAGIVSRNMKKYSKVGAVTLGAVGSIGLGMMRGMMNTAREYQHDRYMQDYSYSRNMMLNSKLGRSTGASNSMRFKSTYGLSNALSARRHG